MSKWFYITGTIEVDVFDNDTAYNEYLIKSAIQDCPDVFGSEGGIDIFINKKTSPAMSSSHDENEIYCGSRNYNLLNRNRFSTTNPIQWTWCKTMETQTRFVITLTGSLRDVTFNDGIKMIQKFLNRFSKMISVDNVCIQVSNGRNRKYVIQDDSCYSKNYEPDEREERIQIKYEKMKEKYMNNNN